jgi:nucleotide-binding universal stress UspA family protein
LVVGVDGSDEARSALRWAAAALVPGGHLHVVHALSPVEELAVDAVLGDSVRLRHHREQLLFSDWVEPVAGVDLEVLPEIVEGAVAESLLVVAAQHGADAVVVGHHPHARFGPQVVGHVTADVLRHARRPVVVVPDRWQPESVEPGSPIVVGVGVAHATRAAITWATERAQVTGDEIDLVHALGPRSLFRPDGVLDVLAYHLDRTVLPDWVADDLMEVAERIADAAGDGVDLSISVRAGRIGPRLVEAGTGARLLVIGRGSRPFTRYTMAPYLRHALTHAPCPVVVVPVEEC